ncbi:MAG: O-antigen ligase family protein [Rhodospirillaceae bacterium]|jgi:O-antigen ligase|nr:O-antigen ligase family protein [Rhodospirillaceae bacterium]MBT5373229.1 O-antigen ligase family protein [Rhodospirillaceae bacterium]MBT5660425.1 O-antigen ligase family protein [Rhodospirillaceae bacterium]MBT5752991.1 O-antigen ligase family protein [Rhodospirillaceae bacterium]
MGFLERLNSMRMALPFLGLAGLAVVPVYAVNGTVILLALFALGLSQPSIFFPRLVARIRSPVGLVLCAFMVWCLISVFWAPDPGQSLSRVAKLICILALGFIALDVVGEFNEKQARKAGNILIFATGCMLGFYILELATDGMIARALIGHPIRELNPVARGTAVLALLIWPVFILLFLRVRHTVPGLIYLALAFVVSWFLQMAAAVFAIAAAFAGFAAFYINRRITLVVIGCLIGFYIFAAPYISLNIANPETVQNYGVELQSNYEHRLAIWQFASKKIIERPLIGYGFDSSRYLGEEEARSYKESGLPLPYVSGLLPLHPHNSILQIWLELGFVGICLFLALITALLREIWLMENVFLGCVAGSVFTAFLVVSTVSFGVWQSWWLAAAWLGMCAITLLRRNIEIGIWTGKKT